MEFNKKDKINYKIERAKETIEDAKLAIDNGRLHNAENRIYYAIFYIVSALALKDDFSTTKHSPLLGWFNKNYVSTKRVKTDLGKIYNRQFENRMEGDYQDFINFEESIVKKDFEEMIKFVDNIEKLIKENNP